MYTNNMHFGPKLFSFFWGGGDGLPYVNFFYFDKSKSAYFKYDNSFLQNSV